LPLTAEALGSFLYFLLGTVYVFGWETRDLFPAWPLRKSTNTREVSTLSLEQPHLQVSKTVQSKARGQRLSHGRASSRRVELGFDGGFSGTVMRLPIMNRNFRTLLA
jgi:hypothetical protein